MPFCDVSRYEKGKECSAAVTAKGVKIYYRRYGRGSVKILLIIGFAGTHDGWGPQVKGLAGAEKPNDEEPVIGGEEFECVDEEGQEGGGVEVCCFDNRGMGRSSVPTKKSEYTTTLMAKDALALLNHLGWKKAHVFGHSMGAMIACKLAAMAPDRLSSLALLNVTGGGYECFPKIDLQMISLAIRFLRAKTPEKRAMVDLETHYTKEYLDELVGTNTRRTILFQQYVKGISSSGMQSNYGFEGQFNACWTHNMSQKELDVIRSSGFLVLIIHGRYDIIAQVCHARKLADRLQPAAKMVELHGAHLVSHERPEEVNRSLLDLIKASQLKLDLNSWSTPQQDEMVELTLSKRDEQAHYLVFTYDILAKMQLSALYIFGLFVMGFKQAKKAVRILKPVRVGAAIS